MKHIIYKHIIQCFQLYVYTKICKSNYLKIIMDERILQIGEKLRKIRIDRGYSSHEFFAWEHNIPRVQYWRMEKGSNFTIRTLLRVLDAHEMSLQEFFDSMDKETN